MGTRALTALSLSLNLLSHRTDNAVVRILSALLILVLTKTRCNLCEGDQIKSNIHEKLYQSHRHQSEAA